MTSVSPTAIIHFVLGRRHTMYARTVRSFLLICLGALLTPRTNAEEQKLVASTRLVNGQIINIAQAPYIVQLRSNTGLFCGGTLVTAQHVVTAAHCFDTMSPQDVVVVGGANTATEAGLQRRIVGFKKHPGYSKATMDNDVAILRLNSPMQGSNIRPIALCSRQMAAGNTLQVSGWGRMYDNGPGSLPLRSIYVPTVSNEQCKAQHRYSTAPITNAMLCAYAPNTDHCGGDSGGPGVFGGELCGIVSWGRGCAVNGSPGVYANVSTLRAYITQAIQSL